MATSRKPDQAPRKRATTPRERPGPAGGKRDQNRRERTRTLLDAALALFLERGIDAVTIDQITRRAEVAKGSFYRYFETKDALVDALLDPIVTRLEHAFAACALALQPGADAMTVFTAYHALGLALAQTVRTEPSLVRLYLQERHAPVHGPGAPIRALSSRISQVAVDLTMVAHDRGLLRRCNPHVSALAVVGAVERLLEAWLSGELVEHAGEDVVAELVSIMLDGLRP